jgi:hypothetical protein
MSDVESGIRNIALTEVVSRGGDHEQRITTMTALQDWLSFRPVEEGFKDGLREVVFRPLRAVLSVVEDFDAAHGNAPDFRGNVVWMRPGLERC